MNHVELSPTDLRNTVAPPFAPDEKKNLNDFFATNKSLFVNSTEPTLYTEHSVVLFYTPISVFFYRMSKRKRQLFRSELDRLLEAGVIE